MLHPRRGPRPAAALLPALRAWQRPPSSAPCAGPAPLHEARHCHCEILGAEMQTSCSLLLLLLISRQHQRFQYLAAMHLRLTCIRCELPITLAALHFVAHLSGWPGPGSRGRAGTGAGALPRRPCVAHALPGPPTCRHRQRPLANLPSPAAARTHFKALVHKHWSI